MASYQWLPGSGASKKNNANEPLTIFEEKDEHNKYTPSTIYHQEQTILIKDRPYMMVFRTPGNYPSKHPPKTTPKIYCMQ